MHQRALEPLLAGLLLALALTAPTAGAMDEGGSTSWPGDAGEPTPSLLFHPFIAFAGSEVNLTLRLPGNDAGATYAVNARATAPANWTVTPGNATVPVAPGTSELLVLTYVIPETAQGLHVLEVNVTRTDAPGYWNLSANLTVFRFLTPPVVVPPPIFNITYPNPWEGGLLFPNLSLGSGNFTLPDGWTFPDLNLTLPDLNVTLPRPGEMVPTPLRPFADVNLTVTGPAHLPAGRSANLQARLHNGGLIPVFVNLQAEQENWTHDARVDFNLGMLGWASGGSLTQGGVFLAPNETRTLTVPIRVTSSTPPGERVLTFSATPTTGGASGGNVRYVLNVTAAPAPVDPVNGAAEEDRVDSAANSAAPAGDDGTVIYRALLTTWDAATGTPGAAAATATGISLLALLAALRREAWRYRFLVAGAALYTRLAKPRVLDHETRDAIHALIAQTPGVNYSTLKALTGLNTGALVHHLRTLEKHHYVTSRREGALRCFYPMGPRLADPAVRLTPLQERILGTLHAEGPLAQKALAERLGVSKQSLHYNVKALERHGRLALVEVNDKLLCTLTHPDAAPGSEAAPASGHA